MTNAQAVRAPAFAGQEGASTRQTLGVLRHYLRPRRAAFTLGALLLFSSGVLSLIQPLAAKNALDALSTGGVPAALTLLTGLVLAAALALGFGQFLVLRAAEAIVLDGRTDLVRRVLRLTIAGMRGQAPGDLISRVTADTTLLRQIATQCVIQVLSGAVTLVGALVLMAFVDIVLFGVAVLVVGLLGGVVGVIMPSIRRAARRAQTGVGDLGGRLERALTAFSTVKASGTEDHETGRIAAAAKAAHDQGVVLARWASIAGTTGGLAIQAAFLLVLGVGGARVAAGQVSVSTLVAFLLYVLYLAQPLTQLVNAGTYFQAGRAAVQRIRELDHLPTEDVDGAAPPTAGATGPVAVSLRGVGFTYPGRAETALRELDLDIPAGGMTALVGPSGAGKSTVLGLIERFHDPDLGTVLVDGRDARDWDLRHLRSVIGYVEQDAPVMAGTLRENLLYATPGADDGELLEVLDDTRLRPLFDRLGGDLDADIAHRGTSMSGGERQRVAIARALLRRPRLLLLDEATSQLDAVNEAALRDVVDELAERMTVVVVAHRLSTVHRAARIAVMEDGHVVGVGTHQALIRENSLYESLVAGQLLR